MAKGGSGMDEDPREPPKGRVIAAALGRTLMVSAGATVDRSRERRFPEKPAWTWASS